MFIIVIYLLCFELQNTSAAVEVDTGAVRDRFGGMGRFKDGSTV